MRRAVVPMLALVALVLGVVNAGARTTDTHTLTVEVLGKGNVKSTASGINCGDGSRKCFIAFGVDEVTLKAKAGGGWTFGGGWAGCSASGDSCDVDLSSDALVTVTFDPKTSTSQSTLGVTFDDSVGKGKVTGPEAAGDGSAVDCGTAAAGMCSWGPVPSGSTLTVFEQPASASDLFAGWGGACSGTGVACTVELDGDRTISAVWGTSTGTATLTVGITGGGKVSGGGIDCPSSCVATESLNSAVTLNASPSDGYVFTGWSGGTCAGTSPTCTVTMTGPTAITATFAQANVLGVTISGNGAVTGGSGAINCGGGAEICSANFASGATVSLVATPAVGAIFAGWTGACGGTATTCTVSMTQSRNVTATFTGGAAGTGFTLSVSVTGNGTVSGGGISCGAGATTCTSAGHAANSAVTLTATPASGATFTGWGGGTCAGTSPTCTVTFNAAKTVTASFSGGSSTFALTVTVTGPGRVTGGGISCGNGATACTATFTPGTTAVLTQAPASGSSFRGWGGSCTGTAATCAISMTAAKAVSASFGAAGTPGTLTMRVLGRGSVSTALGACASTGGTKTCVQHFKAGTSAALTARPGQGQAFIGWSGACAGKKSTCAVKLTTAQTATATFSNTPVKSATLRSLGRPIVVRTSTGYRVTLRFVTTKGGTARVRGIRAGRAVTTVAAKVAAGRVRIGPFPVARGGLYVFETRLAGGLLKTPACLGRCGPAAPPPTFTLTREPPVVTRAGDVWSVTLHASANQIYDGRLRTFRGTKLLVNQHFLGRAGRVAFGPFLLGSGNYTLRLAGIDGYGRARSLTWLVSLGR